MYLVGNISITLSVNFVASQFFIACINIFEREPGVGILEGTAYQVYLIFLGITLLTNAVSALGNKWLPWIDTAAIFWTLIGMVCLAVTILAIAKNGRHDAEYVFTHFKASSGWSDGWSFCVGLLHAGYATSSTGMIISSVPSTAEDLALTLVYNVRRGAEPLDSSSTRDGGDNLYQYFCRPSISNPPVGSSGGAFALLVPLLVLLVICGIDCTTATSRCVFAFARDGAIPQSRWWVKVNHRLDNIPLNAMMLSMVVGLALGLIFFGNTTAFNAFSGVGVICLTVAYASPIAINLFTGRKQVQKGRFYLGALGTISNVIAIGWTLLVIPLFCMPASIPVTASTVNYAPVVFVFAVVVSGICYWAWGYENYVGPPTQDG
ncbi:hypothetical protein MRS44_011258 [Fusarium solani]|uniref:uncharacterized protein n=1 Tax=Fusarium solani TaxID=169388 RepID=UPI0032C416D2|nr:hypothetical protein MRS44_011258 [Fusarium solani]